MCGLTGMGEYFSQVTPRNGAKSIEVSFCLQVNKYSCLSCAEYIAHGLLKT